MKKNIYTNFSLGSNRQCKLTQCLLETTLFHHQRAAVDLGEEFQHSRTVAKTLTVWLSYACLPANVLTWIGKVIHCGNKHFPSESEREKVGHRTTSQAKTHFTHFSSFGNIKCRPTCMHASTHTAMHTFFHCCREDLRLHAYEICITATRSLSYCSFIQAATLY